METADYLTQETPCSLHISYGLLVCHTLLCDTLIRYRLIIVTYFHDSVIIFTVGRLVSVAKAGKALNEDITCRSISSAPSTSHSKYNYLS